MRVMISQPMAGLTLEEIQAVRRQAIAELEERGYEVVNSLFVGDADPVLNPKKEDLTNDTGEFTKTGVITYLPIAYLAESLKVMATCDAVYFVRGWAEARGCRMENQIALEYGMINIYQ